MTEPTTSLTDESDAMTKEQGFNNRDDVERLLDDCDNFLVKADKEYDADNEYDAFQHIMDSIKSIELALRYLIGQNL